MKTGIPTAMHRSVRNAIHRDHRPGRGPHRGVLLGLRAALGGMAIAGTLSLAQTPPQAPPARPPALNGTIVSLTGDTLQLKTLEQASRPVTLSPQLHIINQKKMQLSDVQSGKFIGVTAVQGPDGKLHAREIHIFPEAMRGAGEGHYPMGGPNTTMTNGNVATMTNGNVSTMTNGSVAASGKDAKGLVLNVDYKGGRSQIEAGPQTPVTLMAPGDRSLLTAGTRVTVILQPGSDPAGTAVPTAANIIVGGLEPAR